MTAKGSIKELSASFNKKAVLIGIFMALLPTIIYGQGTPIKDDAGNVFTLTAPPQRIVSLAPNITEILFAL